MTKYILLGIFSFCLLFMRGTTISAQEWSVKGKYTESCSCNPTCPCHFDSEATLGHCEGNGLLEIKKGRYGDVNLDKIKVVSSLRAGEWIKYYVSDNANEEQVKAIEPMMAAVFGIPDDWKVLSTEKASVSVERSDTKVKFSVPESSVEIEMMKGLDGKPIKIQNLPVPYLTGYTQYKSISNIHKSKDAEFSYSGTNGLTSEVDISGGK